MNIFIKLLIIPLPWGLKRRLLKIFFKYDLHSTARIGLAWIYPAKLTMREGAKIAHFTTAIHLDEIMMEKNASIGRSNWITGFTSGKSSKHFQHQPGRKSVLLMKEGAAVTKKHHLDCTSSITIGKYTTIAGYDSQFLTHSIDILQSRQDSHPIKIGDYCFVSTNVVVLGGAVLPDYAVLGAKSLLNKNFEDSFFLYAGVPASQVKSIPKDAAYFLRKDPFVY
jgi:acetyltransferase-like isoleucine patch superfamily enzyme